MDLLCKLVPSAEKEGGRSKKSKHSVGVINGWSLSVGRRERECAPIRMPYMRALHAAIFFFFIINAFPHSAIIPAVRSKT